MSWIFNKFRELDYLLIMRGFACIMVILFHCSPPITPLDVWGYDLSYIYRPHGTAAVWVFFTLSGYLMGKAFYTNRYKLSFKGIKKFFKGRAKRIMPLYYFVTLVTVALLYTYLIQPDNLKYLFKILTFRYDQGDQIWFNTPYWSISTEMHFYLLLPVIFFVVRKFSKSQVASWLLLVATFLGGLFLRYYIWTNHTPANELEYNTRLNNPIWSNWDFFVGGLLLNPIIVYLTDKMPKFFYKIRHFLGIALMLSVYLVSAYYGFERDYALEYGLNSSTVFLPTLISVIAVLFIFVNETGEYNSYKKVDISAKRFVKNPLHVFEILGVLSYGMFIWHVPIIGSVVHIMNWEPQHYYLTKVGIVLIFSILLATSTYYLVEKAFLRKKKTN